MKKIAIFLPDLRGGGAERVAVHLANTFILRGFKVDLVLCSAHGDLLSQLNRHINVVDLSSPRLRYIFLPLLRYLKIERPDVLLASMWPLTLSAVAAFKCARLPGRVVVSDHTTFSQAPLLKKKTNTSVFQVKFTIDISFC